MGEKKYLFDSSTAILLAKITLFRLFASEKEIIITPKIRQEILQKRDAEDTIIIELCMKDKIVIELSRQPNKMVFLIENFGLDDGEAEVLAFALDLGHGYIVATDDYKAIKACKILNIPFVTAVHCLLSYHKTKKENKKITLEKLKKLEKYGRYNIDVIKEAKLIIEGE